MKSNMKLKLSILLALSLVANNAYGMWCYTDRVQNTLFSELSLGNGNWFIETDKHAYDNYFSWVADSMAISCNSGISMVKKTSFDSFLSAGEYFVFRSDSLVAPLYFDSQSDTIKLIFYINQESLATHTSIYTVVYGNNATDMTKAPFENQSIMYYRYNCVYRGYITDQPTPGAYNNIIVGENEVTNKNTPLACNPSRNGKSLNILIDAAFDQRSTLVAIYNMSGDEVFLRFLTGEASFDVDTESFLAGMYVVALKNNQGTVMTTAFSVQ